MRVGGWLAAAVLCLAACGGGGGGGAPAAPALELTTFQAAAVVVGQPVFALNDPNQGEVAPTSQTLAQPGMASSGPFFLPDTSNHRVLGYDQVPFLNHIGANFALGQPGLGFGFEGLGPTALREPRCARVSGGRLFVSDSGNHRVLVWNRLPSSNAAPADLALGQPDLGTGHRGDRADELRCPTGIAVTGERLLVVDRCNHRVLIWLTIPRGSGQPADLVLGQEAFGQSLPNRGGGPGPHTLHDPFAVWSDGVRVVVADRGNHRVLVWRAFPTTPGQPADFVLGQPDFQAAQPRLGAGGLSSPSDVTSDGSRLLVADAGNHRVLLWSAFPDDSATPADVVLGQAAFVHGAPNDADQDGVPDLASSARTFFAADRVLTVTIVGGDLFVGDTGNHRMLVFHGD